MTHGIAIDPAEFLSDPQVRPFKRDYRVDLLAPDVEQLNPGVFKVYERKTDKQKVDVVRYIAPYAMERTDIGNPSESFRMITPEDGNGFFAFSPLVGGQTPVILEVNYNAPRAAAGPLSNADRQRRSGITSLSEDPWVDVQRSNPFFSIAVPSEVEFLVTFEILPPATAAGIPNPFSIGAGAIKRVDFAGVVVYGVTMPQTLYNRILEEVQKNGRGS